MRHGFDPERLEIKSRLNETWLSVQEGFVMKSVFDSSFRYTPSSHTDVRKTFERIRREQQAKIRQEQQAEIRQEQQVSADSAGAASE